VRRKGFDAPPSPEREKEGRCPPGLNDWRSPSPVRRPRPSSSASRFGFGALKERCGSRFADLLDAAVSAQRASDAIGRRSARPPSSSASPPRPAAIPAPSVAGQNRKTNDLGVKETVDLIGAASSTSSGVSNDSRLGALDAVGGPPAPSP